MFKCGTCQTMNSKQSPMTSFLWSWIKERIIRINTCILFYNFKLIVSYIVEEQFFWIQCFSTEPKQKKHTHKLKNMHLASLKSILELFRLNPPLALLISILNHTSSIQSFHSNLITQHIELRTNQVQKVHQSSDIRNASCHCHQLHEQIIKRLTITSPCRNTQKSKTLKMSCISQDMPLDHNFSFQAK